MEDFNSLQPEFHDQVLPKIDGFNSFKCNECDEEFEFANVLRTHKKNFHKLKRPTRTRDEWNHKCSICDRMFGASVHLRDHIKAIHTGTKEFGCKYRVVL